MHLYFLNFLIRNGYLTENKFSSLYFQKTHHQKLFDFDGEYRIKNYSILNQIIS